MAIHRFRKKTPRISLGFSYGIFKNQLGLLKSFPIVSKFSFDGFYVGLYEPLYGNRLALYFTKYCQSYDGSYAEGKIHGKILLSVIEQLMPVFLYHLLRIC